MTPASRPRAQAAAEGAAAAAVTAVVEEIFAAAQGVREDTLRMLRQVTAHDRPLTGRDIAGLRPGIRARLRRNADLVIGLGLIIAPGVLGDEPLRLEWWQQEPGQTEQTALEVDLNRLSLGFYDYEAAEWFAVPRRSRARHVVGPYVDVHGSGAYVLTFTVPVLADGRFLGVAGADVSAARFESRLARALTGRTGAVILNADHRVVFSTSARWLTGSRLLPSAAPELHLAELPSLPWRLGTVRPGNH